MVYHRVPFRFPFNKYALFKILTLMLFVVVVEEQYFYAKTPPSWQYQYLDIACFCNPSLNYMSCYAA